MFGLLSRSNAVCRRDWAFRAIVLGAQKSPQIGLRKVVLSGFPTALEPTPPPSLREANAGALPPYRRTSRLPLPRDEIPQQPPVVVCARSFRLRLARRYGSSYSYSYSYSSSLLKGAVWEGRTEFFLGGIEKSIAREGQFGVMCVLQHMKSGKKPAVGLDHFLPIPRKPPM